MAINFGGGGEPGRIYLGSNQVNKIFFGSTEVWPTSQTIFDQVEGLRYQTTANGRSSSNTLKVPGVDALPSGISISGSLINVTSYTGDLTDWDFRNYTLTIKSSMGTISQCLFGETSVTGIFSYLDVYTTGSVALVEYCDFTGPFTYGGAGTAINTRVSGTGVSVVVGEITDINRCRFTGLGSDAIKAGGGQTAAGERIRWCYFGAPVNLPFLPAAWSSATTYNTGDWVYHTNTNYVFRSLTDNNLNNTPPTSKTDNAFWENIDPHSDAITVFVAINKVSIENCLIDMTEDPVGVYGPYPAIGLNNAFRIARNTNANDLRFDEVVVQECVVRTSATSTSYPIDVYDSSQPNFNGPIRFVASWMEPSSTNNYFHPNANGLVQEWINMRDIATGNLIAAPTGATITSGISTPLVLTELPRDKMIIDAEIIFGNNQARLTLSGTAEAGEVIQGYDNGADSWSDIATADGAGDWSGELLVTNVDGAAWRTAQVRYKNDPSQTATSTNTFSPGVVFAFLSQSELQQAIQSFQDQSAAIAIQDDDILQMVVVDDDTAVTPSLTHYHVTQANKDSQSGFVGATPKITNSVAALANVLSNNAPGRRFLFLDMMHSGTSRVDLGNDSDTDRYWTHLQAMIDWVRNNGSDVGVVYEMWYAADRGQQFKERFAPLYFGQDWAGSTFTLGTTHSLISAVVDHCYFDLDTTADDFGRGVFRRDRTKFVQASTNFFASTSDLSNAETVASDSSSAYDLVNARRTREDLDLFHQDSRTQECFAPLSIDPICVRQGEFSGTWSDTSHPSDDDPDGLPLMYRHAAVAILHALGDISFTIPTWEMTTLDASGNYVEFQASGGAGTLTTLRLQRAEAAITGQPHYTEVMGFEIDQGSGFVASGFTATVVDDTNRIVRITPDTPFVNNDAVRFGWGGSTGHRIYQTDFTNEVYKNVPIIDYSLPEYPGVPVAPYPRSDNYTVSGLSGGGGGAVTFTTSATGPYFLDPVAFGANTGKLFQSVKASITTPAAAVTLGLINGTYYRLEALPNGSLRINVKDSGNVVLASNVTSAAGALSYSGTAIITVSVDLVSQYARVYVNGTNVIDQALAANTGLFPTTSRVLSALATNAGANQTTATVEYIKYWKDATTDGTEPLTTEYKSIVGPAATANADSWKLGADAT